MKTLEAGFDTEKYLASQSCHLRSSLTASNGNPVFMEFGGKPFGDHHAERVLPGYDADCKAKLLASLIPVGKVIMVVNARDILLPEYGRTLQGRIRGDSQLRYDDETVRLIRRARDLDFDINKVVVAISLREPTDRDRRALDGFRESLFQEGVTMHSHYEIPDYPNPDILDNADDCFSANDVIAQANSHLIAFSPGGGSGKFGVLLSEMYHALRQGQNPHFIKFETFPVFTVEPDNALNLAFEAATADLQNRVIALCSDPQKGTVTSYDKDVQNYALLKKLFDKYRNGHSNTVDFMDNPTEMSVNRILDGITDEDAVIDACREEIKRRIQRYASEETRGIEKAATVQRAIEIYDIFVDKYGE